MVILVIAIAVVFGIYLIFSDSSLPDTIQKALGKKKKEK